jgi:DNA-binding transcriptional LysR family regulator
MFSDHVGAIMSNGNNETLGIRELEVFVSVMATGSMTGAARQLGIGQPAVTRMVRDLEATIGFELFRRNGPRISPTSKGVKFFENARQLLASFEQVTQRATSLREGRIQSLALVANPAMAAGLVPGMLAALDRHSGLPPKVSLQTMDAEHLAQVLLSGAVDYGACAMPLSHSELDCLCVARAGLVAVLPPDLPTEPLDVALFRQYRLLSLGNSYRIRHAINAHLAKHGVEPVAELVTNSSLNAIRAATEGLGIALVDCVSARGIAVAGARIVPLVEQIPYEWGLFRRTGTGLPELEDALLDSFCNVSRELGAEIISLSK